MQASQTSRDEKVDLNASSTMSDFMLSHDGVQSRDSDEPLVRKSRIRFVMLALACLFLMGSYFCYDNPAPLKTRLVAPPFNFTNL